jgi:hypothetical protein
MIGRESRDSVFVEINANSRVESGLPQSFTETTGTTKQIN